MAQSHRGPDPVMSSSRPSIDLRTGEVVILEDIDRDIHELEKDHSFINQIMDAAGNALREDWQKYGRRNLALPTTAPVGTVSMLTQTTSGIEPAFLLEYKRRKKIISEDELKFHIVEFSDKLLPELAGKISDYT